MINIKDFDPGQIKIGKKSYKNIGIYNIGYVTKKTLVQYYQCKSTLFAY